MNERSSRTVEGDGGVPLSVLELRSGASPETVLFAHATGFCKEVWLPIVDDVADACQIDAVLFDTRAHGSSGRSDPPLDWWDLGRDVLALTDPQGAVVGVGHSAGAASLVLAELMAPGTFAMTRRLPRSGATRMVASTVVRWFALTMTTLEKG